MTRKAEILARLIGQGNDSLLYLPDLTLWYPWHKKQGTLPEKWRGMSMAQITRSLNLPVWQPVRPWRLETPGVKISTVEENNERVIKTEAPSGTLIARWIVGPDGDWWQTEYPVKTEADFAAALELAQARTYVLDPAPLQQAQTEVGNDGVVAIEIPRRPWSDILHEFLGWSEGLMFLTEPVIAEINAALEVSLQKLVAEIAVLPETVVLSPDNLDGQFIPPRTFDEFLTGSYRQTAETLHQHGKLLVVHVGGPIKHILPKLAQSGVDCIEGVCGPPQGDVSLAEARQLAGPELTLWGGLAQDFLLDHHDEATFAEAVAQAAQAAQADPRAVLGVADRIPVEAMSSRLEAIGNLLELS